MEGKAIEQACVLTSATSPDVVIVMNEIPEHTPDLRVPVEIFHVGNELSKKTSSSDPSRTSFYFFIQVKRTLYLGNIVDYNDHQ
ncbi:hypothetical protein AVEN_42610-1 [Araneus ventricosus]|uniref:Uncharacterized protein n=1 Tax=Araneus ventricosus TaxID=182803 RepID=A0A4Y2GR79_ARAVE|nr:hypothetical protein AVEN_42610-1 [Araneus ventricosus]